MTKLTGTYRKLVRGTTINETTLLSTDYLNHFNELVMMVEMAADMPDLLDDALEWHFKDYQAHFADSVFKHKDLAVWAYESTPDDWKVPFDTCTTALRRRIEGGLTRLEELRRREETERFRTECLTFAEDVRHRLDGMSAIINGAAPPEEAKELAAKAKAGDAETEAAHSGSMLDQSEIDRLFD